MVRLRLKRFGRRNRPFYRITAMDQRTRRDGRTIEQLGHFDPIEPDTSKQITVDVDRAKYWLSVGAQPTATVKTLLKRAGVEVK